MEGEKVLKQVQYITDVIKWTIICFYLQLSGVKAYYKIFIVLTRTMYKLFS